MAEIAPFRGWRYDFDRVGPPETVLAPPYDLVTPQCAARLRASHPYQIAHLILGHPPETGVQAPEVYAQAAAAFEAWKSDGILTRDERPAVYPYLQEFAGPNGVRLRRWGFIAAMALHDFADRAVMPHEEIFARPYEDRRLLTQAAMANFTPVFVLYRDPERAVEQALSAAAHPVFSMTDDEAVTHRFFRVDDPAAIQWAQDVLRDQTFLIADGHHRYAAALAVRDELRLGKGESIGHRSSVIGHRPEGAPPWEFCLACLVNSFDEGLLILPTHRLVGAGPRVRPQQSARLDPREFAAWFRVEAVPGSEKGKVHDFLAQSRRTRRPGFALYDGQQFLILEVEDWERIEALMDPDKPPVWRRLGLAILDRLVFRQILGLDSRTLDDPAAISFTADAEEAIAGVDSGRFGLAALVPPPSIEEIWRVCESGARMPRKSTFFYPKLASGTVIRDLRDW